MHIKLKALDSAAPYLHAKLASIELKPMGHPGGPAVRIFDPSDDALDVTPEAETKSVVRDGNTQ